MTNRNLPPSLAAAKLSQTIFGPHRSYHRIGGVHVVGAELVVRTPVAPEKWPADRLTVFEGHAVRWECVGSHN